MKLKLAESLYFNIENDKTILSGIYYIFIFIVYYIYCIFYIHIVTVC